MSHRLVFGEHEHTGKHVSCIYREENMTCLQLDRKFISLQSVHWHTQSFAYLSEPWALHLNKVQI